MSKLEGFAIETSRGFEKWYEIDRQKYYGETYYLMESEKYGDEYPSIILNSKLEVVEWNWRDSLELWFEENME